LRLPKGRTNMQLDELPQGEEAIISARDEAARAAGCELLEDDAAGPLRSELERFRDGFEAGVAWANTTTVWITDKKVMFDMLWRGRPLEQVKRHREALARGVDACRAARNEEGKVLGDIDRKCIAGFEEEIARADAEIERQSSQVGGTA
jgi:hypothetical protein